MVPPPTNAAPPSGRRSPAPGRPGRVAALAVLAPLAAGLLAGGCQRQPSIESQRIDRLELKIQQLEQRLNKTTLRTDPADKAGKPPAGVIKSLTFRSGTEDDRLRIYWSNGTTTDLPCTKEQATLACG